MKSVIEICCYDSSNAVHTNLMKSWTGDSLDSSMRSVTWLMMSQVMCSASLKFSHCNEQHAWRNSHTAMHSMHGEIITLQWTTCVKKFSHCNVQHAWRNFHTSMNSMHGEILTLQCTACIEKSVWSLIVDNSTTMYRMHREVGLVSIWLLTIVLQCTACIERWVWSLSDYWL